MLCQEVRQRLESYIDDELGPTERQSLSDHLAGCPDCSKEAAALTQLSAEIRAAAPSFRAPAALRERIRDELRRAAPAVRRSPPRMIGALAYAASLLLAVALGSGGTVLLLGQQRTDSVADELLDDHLRSLLAGHLTDVASSDQHTVKPWFAGRSDLSPPVVDLAADGFPLLGGRLDLVAGRPVPALVYSRHQHIINLFVLPARADGRSVELARHGYTLIHWDRGDLGFWAVSDAAPSELDGFVKLYRAASAS
jgi:anti-sigma factor (TIGR02949 family)